MKNYSAAKCQEFLNSAKLLFKGDMNLKNIFELFTNLRANKRACTYFDKNGYAHHYTYTTYKKMAYEAANKLSVLLKDAKRDSIVGLKLGNCPSWPIMFWAILMSGHKPLLLDAKALKEATVALLKNADASALISDEKIDGLDIPCLSVKEIMLGEPNKRFIPDWQNKVLFCSSGTTGNAKMFVFDGECLCRQILASLEIPKQSTTLMHPGRINILAMIPYHHVFGFMVVFLWYNFYGKNVVYPRSINADDLLFACQKGRCTHVFSVPLFWDSIAQKVERTINQQEDKTKMLAEMMMDYNLGDLSKKTAGFASSKIVRNTFQKKVLGNKVQYAISGGGYLNPHTANVINGLGYPLYNGYGMTELGITSVEQSPKVEDRLKASIGKPFYGVSYRIAGDNNRGELLVKAGSMHKFRLIDGKKVPIELTEDGYFWTGDIAEKTEDGRYYIRGRQKDVIINSNGENVYPDELESIFKGLSHTQHNVVLGVKDDKNSLNETITLVLEINKETDEEGIKSIRKEFEALNASLPNEKRIERAYITKKPLPLANGMKVKRFIIKEALEKGQLDGYDDFVGGRPRKKARQIKRSDFSAYDQSLVNDVMSKIARIWAKALVLKESDIKADSHFAKDLGGDSMTYVSMVQNLNEEFSIEIPMEMYGLLTTPDEFAKLILDLQKKKKGE